MNIIIAGDYYPQGLFNWDPEIESIVKSSDYSIINFESPIISNGSTPIIKFGPNLHSTTDSIDSLQRLGFSCVTLANNHIMDFGSDSLLNTIEILNERKVDYVGAGESSKNAAKPIIKQLGNKKIGIINCCEHEFSVTDRESPGANPLDPISQYNSIKAIKNSTDYIIVIVHGGPEGFQLPSTRMQDNYRFLIDAGANIVINHHQHCYSGYENYNNGLIFYGLGNFFFPKTSVVNTSLWEEGIFLKLHFENSKIHYHIYPYKQDSLQRRIELMDEKGIQNFNNRIAYLNSIIKDRDRLEKENRLWRLETETQYKSSLSPYNNRYLTKLWLKKWLPCNIGRIRLTKLINFIECESHRERYISYLKNLLKEENSIN